MCLDRAARIVLQSTKRSKGAKLSFRGFTFEYLRTAGVISIYYTFIIFLDDKEANN